MESELKGNMINMTLTCNNRSIVRIGDLGFPKDFRYLWKGGYNLYSM